MPFARSMEKKEDISPSMEKTEGILLVDKPKGKSSFDLVRQLRRLTGIKKIGHAGTLDPLATGVMVLLVGRNYTRKSDELLGKDKVYLATLALGVQTDTFDAEGQVTQTSSHEPSLEDVELALEKFQGKTLQTPPMHSAKKVGGKKLYELARKGIEIQRAPALVEMNLKLVSYRYPQLILEAHVSKGTYIRSLANDLGEHLGCYAHLSDLKRTASMPYTLEQCLNGDELFQADCEVKSKLLKL